MRLVTFRPDHPWHDDPPIVMRHSNINTTPINAIGAGRPKMTKGEYRVGYDFNPSGSMDVTSIKRLAADLIDLIEGIPNNNIPEVGRLKALAQTAIEDGAMWAVKAATKKPMARPDADAAEQQKLVEEPKEE